MVENIILVSSLVYFYVSGSLLRQVGCPLPTCPSFHIPGTTGLLKKEKTMEVIIPFWV